MPRFLPLAILDCLYSKTFWRPEQFLIPMRYWTRHYSAEPIDVHGARRRPAGY